MRALNDVSLRVEAGEFVAVMGPSGSGKSTLLTIAGGMELPTEGTVTIDGVGLQGLSVHAMAQLRRERIGYVFQSLNLLSSLTAAENVRLPLELDGVARRPAHVRAVEQLESIGLGDRIDHFPDDLSGGEQQRVALARAMVTAGKLILADEPTGALDSLNGEAVMRTLRRACDNGASAVVVTHDAQLAARADRIVFLRDGRIVDQTRSVAPPDNAAAIGAT